MSRMNTKVSKLGPCNFTIVNLKKRPTITHSTSYSLGQCHLTGAIVFPHKTCILKVQIKISYHLTIISRDQCWVVSNITIWEQYCCMISPKDMESFEKKYYLFLPQSYKAVSNIVSCKLYCWVISPRDMVIQNYFSMN